MHLANIVLIDDDQFVRSALTAALSSYGIKTLGAFDGAKNALDLVRKGNVEVCIVDLDLGPGPSGIDICHSLREAKFDVGLVMLTSYSHPRISQPNGMSLPKGCRFVTKNNLSDFSDLVREILIARNNPLANTSIIKKDSINLTSSQLEILKLVASGMSSQEIAERRGLTLKAIEASIAKISKILDIENEAGTNKRVKLAREYFKMSGKN